MEDTLGLLLNGLDDGPKVLRRGLGAVAQDYGVAVPPEHQALGGGVGRSRGHLVKGQVREVSENKRLTKDFLL